MGSRREQREREKGHERCLVPLEWVEIIHDLRLKACKSRPEKEQQNIMIVIRVWSRAHRHTLDAASDNSKSCLQDRS